MAYPVVATTSQAIYTVTGGAGTGFVTISLPSGTAAGDLLIAKAGTYDGTGAAVGPTPPAGWTTLDTVSNGTSGFSTSWKIATSADVTAGSFIFSNFPASNNGISGEVRMVRITGADGTNPISNSTHNHSTGTAASTTGFTTLQNALLLEFVTSVRNAAVVVSVAGYAIASNNPTWTETYDDSVSDTNNTSRTGNAMAWANQTVVAATGTASATITNGTLAYHMSFIGVTPAATVVPTPLAISSVLNNVIVPIVVTMPLSIISLLGTPIVSEIVNKWNNTVKHVSSWFNTDKTP